MSIFSTTATETETARSGAGRGAPHPRQGVGRDRGELPQCKTHTYSCWRKHALELSPFLSLVRILPLWAIMAYAVLYKYNVMCIADRGARTVVADRTDQFSQHYTIKN